MLPIPRLVCVPLRLASRRAAFSANAGAAASDAVVRVVAADGSDLEADLDRLDPALSHGLVTTTLRALTDRGAPAARFFAWACLRRSFTPSAHAHNLTDRAFAFLTPPGSSRSGCAKDAARAVLKALDDVGGPCRGSGVFSLVKALASIGEFGAAAVVIEETARSTASGDFVGARRVFDEMRQSEYLLSCLLNNGRVAEALDQQYAS